MLLKCKLKIRKVSETYLILNERFKIWISFGDIYIPTFEVLSICVTFWRQNSKHYPIFYLYLYNAYYGHGFNVVFQLYRYELDANMDGSPTIDYLRGIFGNHLGYFWVNGPSYNNLMSPYVIRLLDGMKIRRLEMMIDDLSEEIA